MSDDEVRELQDELGTLRSWLVSIRRNAEQGLDGRAFLAAAERAEPLPFTAAMAEIERMRQHFHAIRAAVELCEEAGKPKEKQ